MKKHQFSFAVLAFVAATLLLSVGCGSGDIAGDMFAKANDLNIKRLSSLYSVYSAQHGYKGPKDEAEFKAFIGQIDPKRLEMIGVDPDDIDGLFVSERDKQPFRIRWDLSIRPRQGPIPIIFEEDGEVPQGVAAFADYDQNAALVIHGQSGAVSGFL